MPQQRRRGQHDMRSVGNTRDYGSWQQPPQRPYGTFALVAVVIIFVVAIAAFGINACSQNEQSQNPQTSQDTHIQEQPQNQQGSGSSSGESSADNTEGISAVKLSEEQRLATSDSVNDVKPTERVCYITIDDGPSENTPKFIEILDKYGINATWFVLGNVEHFDYIKDIWEHGNQIGLHSYTHEYEQLYASTDSFWDEMEKTADEVEDILGFRPTLLRFPGGSHNSYDGAISDALEKQCKQKGYHYFDWNASTGDSAVGGKTASEIMKCVKSQAKGCHSVCLLMHDKEDKDSTVEALPKIIEYFKKQGYTFEVLTADSFGYHF